MKVVILQGSARKGNTYTITERLAEQMTHQGDVSFDWIFLNELDWSFCRSCHSCFFHGEENCPHHPVVAEVVDRIKAADGLILTTPVYSLHVSALVKNLFDHLSYLIHRPAFHDKKALVLATTAGGGEKAAIKYMASILKLWGFNHVQKMGVKLFSTEITMNSRLSYRVSKAATAFYGDLASGQLHPPTWTDVFYFNVWKAMNSLSNESSSDRQYWARHGWLKTDYYHPRIGLLKRGFSTVLFTIMRMAMTGLSKADASGRG